MGRPKGQALSVAAIIEAAITCLEREGDSALGVNRIARSLGIQPPSMYKHFDNNAALQRSVTLEIWQRFITLCRQQTRGIEDSRSLIRTVGHTARDFARAHPVLYNVMMRVQLELDDPDFGLIVREMISFYTMALKPYSLDDSELVDAMRLLHATFYGFITAEQAGLFTLARSPDASYEWIIQTLINALESKRNQPKNV